MLSEEVRLVLSAQNLASTQIDAVLASLDQVAARSGAADTALGTLSAAALTLDANYQRIISSATRFAQVQEQIASGALSGADALRTQAAATAALEASMASYQTRLESAQRAAGINPATGGVGGGTYGPFAVPTDVTTSPEGRARVQLQEAQYAQQNARIQDLIDQTNRAIASPRGPGGGSLSDLGGLGEGVSGIMGGLGTSLLYSIGFASMAGLQQQFSQGVQAGLQSASTVATTGIRPQDWQRVLAGINQLIASGQSLYSPLQLEQGAYSLASVGVTDPAAVLAMLRHGTALSNASLSPDVASSTNALVTLAEAYGIPIAQMAAQATPLTNVLYETALQGKTDPSQLAPVFSTFAGVAGANRISLPDLGALLAFGSRVTHSAQLGGQDILTLLNNIIAPEAQKRQYFTNLGLETGPGALTGPGGVAGYFQHLLAATGQAGPQVQEQMFSRMFDVNTLELLANIAQQPETLYRLISQQRQAARGPDLAQAGSQTVLSSAAGQFQVAVKQFTTSVQEFATQALPLITQLIQHVTPAVQAAAHPAGIPLVGGIVDTLTTGGAQTLQPAQTGVQSWINQHLSWIPGQGVGERQLDALFGITPPGNAPGGGGAAALTGAQLAQINALSAADRAAFFARRPDIAAAYQASQRTFAAFQQPLTLGMSPALAHAATMAAQSMATPPALPAALGAVGQGFAPGMAALAPSAGFLRNEQLINAQPVHRGTTPAGLALNQLKEQFQTAMNLGETDVAAQILQQIATFEQANSAELYGSDPYKAAEDVSALQKRLTTATTTVAATGPSLAHLPTAGLGDPRAGYGAVVTRLSADGQANEQTKRLEQLVEQYRDTIAILKSQLSAETTTNSQLKQANASLAALVRQAQHPATSGGGSRSSAARIL